MLTNKGLCMKKMGFNYTIVLLALSFFVGRMAFAEGGFIKTQREDFGQLIKDGVESEKQLREELHKNAGMSYLDEEAKTPKKERRAVALKAAPENIVAPTSTNFSNIKRAKMPSYTDLSQERISQEFESAEH